ncbi:MAG TPA: hypothetical protein VGM78_15500 [Ilumatobacteraceae bacterium]
MASSSSAKKVAKLAQKGKGKKVRFQGGTLFPLIVVGVVLIFGALIVYARVSRPGPGEGAPTSNDHWHAAYGFYVCDSNGLKIEPNLTGILEETDAQGNLDNARYLKTGIHSHGDGVMHWHPSDSGVATGTNARLKVFLANYGVTLSDTKLSFPAGQGGETFEEGKTTCKINGVEKKASLKLWVWNNYSTATTSPPDATYTADMGDVRIKQDGMVFMVAFVPDGTTPKPPESAANLKALGSVDGGGNGLTPDTSVTTVGTATTVPGTGASTPAGGSTVAGTTVTGNTPGSGTTSSSTSASAATEPTSTATTKTTTASKSPSTTGG